MLETNYLFVVYSDDATKTIDEKGSVASKPEKHVLNVLESGWELWYILSCMLS
jgi:nucleolar protein 4